MSGKSGCEYIKCEYVRRDTGGVRCTHPGGICIYRDEADTITRLEAEKAALRAELADLKDGLTAAHMDGFASGKAEATEMLRKREGQLEELRAEVKAYREVEDSLQKEIKRLDAEVERLKAAERIRVAGLRETRDALVEKLRAEVERLRAENAQLKCNFAPILHFARQEQEKRGEPSVVIDSEGIPIENAVLRRNYITLRTRLEQAEAELAAEKGKVERVREWIVKSMICSAPYCKGCVDELEKILKK